MAKKDNRTAKVSGPGKATSKGNKAGAGATQKRPTEKERLSKRIKEAGGNPEGLTLRQLRRELTRIKSEGASVPDLRTENKGTPSLSKDPKVTEMKEEHLMEEVTVTTLNRETGTVKSVKKTRFRAILDMLSHEALTSKNVSAAKEYMDRTIGKSRQEVEHSGEIKVEEQRLPTKAERAAAKAYLQSLREGD